MTTSHVIGLGGFKESGKDAFASFLPENWVTIGMSEPLLEAMIALNPIIDDHGNTFQHIFYNDYNEDYVGIKNDYPEVRRLLQALGTDVVRVMIDDSAWVNIARKKITRLLEEGKNVAVTGIRFSNEREMIRSFGGTLLWVDRKSVYSTGDAHISEMSSTIEDFDKVVDNNSTLESLRDTARTIDTLLS